jgi:hypothetical protein
MSVGRVLGIAVVLAASGLGIARPRCLRGGSAPDHERGGRNHDCDSGLVGGVVHIAAGLHHLRR